MELETLDLKFSTSRLYIHFDNLFNGDKALGWSYIFIMYFFDKIFLIVKNVFFFIYLFIYSGSHMNMFLNQNWRDILKDVQPAFETALGMAFQSITRQFFHKVPYNKIFN